MKPLQPPDSLHLRAADGWISLGNLAEANAELEQITPELQAHPDVLEMRWQIYAAAKKWEAALDIAAALIKLAPERYHSWVHYSCCLHRLNRTREAYENLQRVADRFPGDWHFLYDLACYECLLGSKEEARRLLQRAFELGPVALRIKALDDPDLEKLRGETGNL